MGGLILQAFKSIKAKEPIDRQKIGGIGRQIDSRATATEAITLGTSSWAMGAGFAHGVYHLGKGLLIQTFLGMPHWKVLGFRLYVFHRQHSCVWYPSILSLGNAASDHV